MKKRKKGNLGFCLFHSLIDQAKVMSGARAAIVNAVHEFIGSLLEFLSAIQARILDVKASHGFSPNLNLRNEYIKTIEKKNRKLFSIHFI